MGRRRTHRKTRRAPLIAFSPEDAQVRLVAQVRMLAGTQILQGGGYILGAPASAPSLLLMREVTPLPVWGAALVVGGILMLYGWLVPGNALCALACMPWAVFGAVVLIQGTATGWGVAWPAGLTFMHGYALYRAARATQLPRPANS